MRLLLILLLMALTPLAFAQSDCEEICCYAEGGTWDPDFEMCNDHYATYLNCINECLEAEQGPYEGSFDYEYSCCGPMFMLIGLVGAAVFLKN